MHPEVNLVVPREFATLSETWDARKYLRHYHRPQCTQSESKHLAEIPRGMVWEYLRIVHRQHRIEDMLDSFPKAYYRL
jgi:predicted transcriptional regulator